MPLLPPNQQRQSTEGNDSDRLSEYLLFSVIIFFVINKK